MRNFPTPETSAAARTSIRSADPRMVRDYLLPRTIAAPELTAFLEIEAIKIAVTETETVFKEDFSCSDCNWYLDRYLVASRLDLKTLLKIF